MLYIPYTKTYQDKMIRYSKSSATIPSHSRVIRHSNSEIITLYMPYMTLFSKLTFDHSRWQVSRVKQGTLTLPEHLVLHPLQGALNCIGCSLAWYLYFTHVVVCPSIYGIEYRYWICLLVLKLLQLFKLPI